MGNAFMLCVLLAISGDFSHTIFGSCYYYSPSSFGGFSQPTLKCAATTCQNLESSIAETRKLLMRSDAIKELLCFMGMKGHYIADAALSASSAWNANHAAKYGRLDFKPKTGVAGAWCARNSQVGQWIQVDFGKPEKVAGVITQGRSDFAQYVKSYIVECGDTIENLKTVQENGEDKVFKANSDQNTKVINKFPELLTCRYLRIYPQTWANHMSMRMEIIRGDCYDSY